MASGKINISIEAIAHDEMQQVAQKIYDKYGIMANAVYIEWKDTSTTGEYDAIVNSVSIDTRKRY